jgi:hypothetical protein
MTIVTPDDGIISPNINIDIRFETFTWFVCTITFSVPTCVPLSFYRGYRGMYSSWGNNTSAPAGSAIPQTTSVGEVTLEVHTSVEAPRNTSEPKK